MKALRPALKLSDVRESVIDAIIEQIDQSLPLIHQQCEEDSSKPPTERLSRAALTVFQDMQDDPLLNKAGTDICLCTKRQKKLPDTCKCQNNR